MISHHRYIYKSMYHQVTNSDTVFKISSIIYISSSILLWYIIIKHQWSNARYIINYIFSGIHCPNIQHVVVMIYNHKTYHHQVNRQWYNAHWGKIQSYLFQTLLLLMPITTLQQTEGNFYLFNHYLSSSYLIKNTAATDANNDLTTDGG